MKEAGIFGAQCRAARAVVGWSQDDLAERASVSRATLNKFETEVGVPHANNLVAIRRSLEGAGFRFVLNENGSEWGLFFKSDA